MSQLKIITLPNPILRERAQPVKTVDAGIQVLVKEMFETLQGEKNPKGIGLAAPQVGISQRICLVYSAKSRKILTLINPEIVWKSKRMTNSRRQPFEGCLSVPGVWGPVQRYQIIKVNYLTLNGQKMTKKFNGLTAIVAQHEIDHLDGILFIDRIKEQKGKLYQIAKNKEGKEELVEINLSQ